MITFDENKKIIDYLLSKNLTLDLLVEIEDHFKEQIEYKINAENKSFDAAFFETKESWEVDLKLKRDFFAFGKLKTKIQKETERKINKEKKFQALKYFVPYFVLCIVFLFVNQEVSNYLVLFGNALIGLFCTFLMIKNYKLFSFINTRSYSRKNISVFQNKMTFVSLGFQTLLFYMPFYNDRFEKFMIYVSNLPELSISAFISISFPFLYVYFGIYGILNFYEYKKVIEILERKINLKI